MGSAAQQALLADFLPLLHHCILQICLTCAACVSAVHAFRRPAGGHGQLCLERPAD